MRPYRRWLILALSAAGCGWDFSSPTAPTGAGGSVQAVLVGAGDIAVCGSTGTEETARLLDSLPGTVFTTGDNAYPSGTAQQFRDCYGPTWGRHKARTRPSPGNHDYESAGGAPYFDYFGPNAGPHGLGYYRYSLGGWQIYSLNSNIPMDASSPQIQWLRQELAANPSTCTLAYWHHPLFSSGPKGDHHGGHDVWRLLYEHDVDIVLAGHDHLYERFAPQDPNGHRDPDRGIRQFIAGTGGAPLDSPIRVHPNSEVRWSAYGVLHLVLRPDGYTWTFLTAGGAPADTGAGRCSTQTSNRKASPGIVPEPLNPIGL